MVERWRSTHVTTSCNVQFRAWSQIFFLENTKSRKMFMIHVKVFLQLKAGNIIYVFTSACVSPSSDTQGWFRSLHRPLGQLVEFPSIYRWTNTITSLVSSSFSDEQDDQWKQFTYDSGYLIGPHTITYRFSAADSKLF